MSLEEASTTESLRHHHVAGALPSPAALHGRKELQPIAPVNRMAYVVYSIKAGFRKLGAGRLTDGGHGAARRRTNVYAGATPANGARRVGGNVLGVKRKAKCLENQSNFEMYLSTLPKVDPVDRTVNWLFHQHQPEAERQRRDTPTGRLGRCQVNSLK